jgi:hypothetical protein
MTPETLRKHSKLIRERLEYNLARDTAMVTHGVQTYRRDSVREVVRSVRVIDDKYTNDRLKELHSVINTFRAIKYLKIEQRPITNRVHCRDEFIGTEYLITYRVLRLEIDDRQVEKHLRTFISKKLTGKKVLYDFERTTPDCKLMGLFMQGKLSWEDCVEAHKSNCKV